MNKISETNTACYMPKWSPFLSFSMNLEGHTKNSNMEQGYSTQIPKKMEKKVQIWFFSHFGLRKIFKNFFAKYVHKNGLLRILTFPLTNVL